MIIPNLVVTDIVRSIAFYRGVLGMELTMTVSANREPEFQVVPRALPLRRWNGMASN